MTYATAFSMSLMTSVVALVRERFSPEPMTPWGSTDTRWTAVLLSYRMGDAPRHEARATGRYGVASVRARGRLPVRYLEFC